VPPVLWWLCSADTCHCRAACQKLPRSPLCIPPHMVFDDLPCPNSARPIYSSQRVYKVVPSLQRSGESTKIRRVYKKSAVYDSFTNLQKRFVCISQVLWTKFPSQIYKMSFVYKPAFIFIRKLSTKTFAIYKSICSRNRVLQNRRFFWSLKTALKDCGFLQKTIRPIQRLVEIPALVCYGRRCSAIALRRLGMLGPVAEFVSTPES
jgi:hypothetical protein